MTVNILGSEWKIKYRDERDDDQLKEVGGYCDWTARLIVIAKRRKDDNVADFQESQRYVLRHEIIHAYMYESGLAENWEHKEIGQEETTVDWIAIQFPKIPRTFKEANAI